MPPPPMRSLEAPSPLRTYDECTADAGLKTAGLQLTPKKEAVSPPQGRMPSLPPAHVELIHKPDDCAKHFHRRTSPATRPLYHGLGAAMSSACDDLLLDL
ncbi:hypothetical protein OsI_12422 [Oryza sativa Indica Group]|uniref:Uncharacterized protein n=1 Tax=Oryza sativa subsp. indica TaxID=39946 RepID=B8ALQ1_ORYSI|nr:hypothetical protein OsI_12422 [Oryza sativa Indica Group]